MRRLIREPLLHFFLVGALLFAGFAALNRDALQAPTDIVVNNERVLALRAQFERAWQRPPTPAELDGLVENWVREEMLYREGVALGFESEDPVIRRRVVQKVAFLTEALVDDTVSDSELDDWLARHADDYRIEPQFTFRQVYFDPRRHGDNLESVVDAAERALQADAGAMAGDATLLPERVELRPLRDVERTFGGEFAERLEELPVSGELVRIRSGFGLHLVHLESRIDGRPAALDDVRQAVLRDVLDDRRRQADEALVESLRKRYRVVTTDDAMSVASGAP